LVVLTPQLAFLAQRQSTDGCPQAPLDSPPGIPGGNPQQPKFFQAQGLLNPFEFQQQMGGVPQTHNAPTPPHRIHRPALPKTWPPLWN